MNIRLEDEKINALVYSGVTIREKGEMLSLTDMWKAAGSPENREPYNWARFDGKAFIEAVAVSQNLSETQVLTSKRGKNGGTYAHWQIGIAYAKYLSPEFHMWCNQVVRSHMGGEVQHLPADVREYIERTDGIVRMLIKKVTHIEHSLPVVLDGMAEKAIAAKMAEQNLLVRKGKTANSIWLGAGLPKGIKGAAVWFGNRLKEGGCLLEGRADRGDSAVRLFDPDKAATLLGLGLLHKAKVYASERMGQSKFKLIGGGK